MTRADFTLPDSTGYLRLSELLLLASVAILSSQRAHAQVTVTADPRASSVVFQESTEGSTDSTRVDKNANAPAVAAAKLQVGFGWSLGFQFPKGDYGSDHGKARGFGFPLQIPVRRSSKEWTFLPTIAEVSSSPGPSEAVGGTVFGSRFKDLEHETKSFGLDVHWRGWNPGPAYVLLGGGIAKVTLDAKKTRCATFVFNCSDTTTPLGSKTAPYVQAGLGFEGDPQGHGGFFIEARWWRGPYLEPIVLSNGAAAGSRSKTGTALIVAAGVRGYFP